MDIYLDSMNSFVGTLQTLVTKTMEDTLMTVKAYEKSRLFVILMISLFNLYYLELNTMHIDMIMKQYWLEIILEVSHYLISKNILKENIIILKNVMKD